MARAIRQFRGLTGIGALTTATQDLIISPGDLPDGSTITRLLGSVVLEYMPAAGSADRALVAMGIGAATDAEVIDVALPNSHPDIWLWWWYQPFLLNHGGADGTTQIARDMTIPLDVHGQRILSITTDVRLHFYARLVGAIGAGTVSVRFGLVHLYKLPET